MIYIHVLHAPWREISVFPLPSHLHSSLTSQRASFPPLITLCLFLPAQVSGENELADHARQE